MSPTSYQTAPSRDIKFSFGLLFEEQSGPQTYLSSNVTFSHLLVGRVSRDILITIIIMFAKDKKSTPIVKC